MNNIFSTDFETRKELKYLDHSRIQNSKIISSNVSDELTIKGSEFAKEITQRFVSNFEKPGDKMAHVSTFVVIDNYVYMSYYANINDPAEDPTGQTARFSYAPLNNLSAMTWIDIQSAGDEVDNKKIDRVYDTILMKKDENTIYVMWTASADGNYYRFYRPFDVNTKTLGNIAVNRFKVGNIINDFSITGIKSALAENEIPAKTMNSDVGIMQKLSSRVENGKTYYYTGMYTWYFTCIIKSEDLITWEYVAQPDFITESKWENATYVIGNKCFYFVRQQEGNPCGFLTAYDLDTGKWESPVEIEDSQSRGDFIYYDGSLYLFHAPIDREHIGIVKIDINDIQNSSVLLQAKMDTSCFYPFVQYFKNDSLAMSYTVSRKHIRLAEFDMKRYV